MMQLQKILCKKRDLVGNSFLELIEENKRQVVGSSRLFIQFCFKPFESSSFAFASYGLVIIYKNLIILGSL